MDTGASSTLPLYSKVSPPPVYSKFPPLNNKRVPESIPPSRNRVQPEYIPPSRNRVQPEYIPQSRNRVQPNPERTPLLWHRTEEGAGGAKAIWWSFNYAFMCQIPDYHEPAVLTSYSFEPELYPNLHMRLDESVTDFIRYFPPSSIQFGNVAIKEADDYHTRAITVNVHVRSHIPQILKAIQPYTQIHQNLDGGHVAEVMLNLTSLTDTLQRQIRYWRCARVDVEIIYPTQMSLKGKAEGSDYNKEKEGSDFNEEKEEISDSEHDGIDSLVVEAYNSPVAVNLPSVVIRKRLSLSSTDQEGRIEIISAASAKQTELTLEQGRISGRLATRQAVYANVKNKGEIYLDIDGNDQRVSDATDPLQALDVAAVTSGGGPVEIRLYTSVEYQGRFNLLHTGKVTLRRSYPELDLVYTADNENRLAGYIAEHGKLPPSPLPHIYLKAAYSGNVSLDLIHRLLPPSSGAGSVHYSHPLYLIVALLQLPIILLGVFE
ncbi:hypothetical protein BGZ58_006837 [Dissophora ornata]|nr:hypothetical protein BGZ58_006837 [Dissophora ornata]